MRKPVLFGLAAALLLAIAFCCYRLYQPRTERLEFLRSSAPVERIVKDPRYGGGKRTVYHLSGNAEDVQKQVELELGSPPIQKLEEYAIYKYGDSTIYVGQGKAIPWSEIMAIAPTFGADQYSQEILQKQFFLRKDSTTVAVAIDEPVLKAAEKSVQKLSRATSPPPEKFSYTAFSYALSRRGEDVVVKVSYENKGEIEAASVTLRNFTIGGKQAVGLPTSLNNLKPGDKGDFVVTFPGLGSGTHEAKFDYEEVGVGKAPTSIPTLRSEKLKVP